LAEFLTELCAELSEAQSRSAQDSLKLGVEEISVIGEEEPLVPYSAEPLYQDVRGWGHR
jgi:hypothetical protein